MLLLKKLHSKSILINNNLLAYLKNLLYYQVAAMRILFKYKEFTLSKISLLFLLSFLDIFKIFNNLLFPIRINKKLIKKIYAVKY